MTYLQAVNFYSTCKAPTEREILQKELGMGDTEFELYEEFLDGISDNWLILS